MEPNPSARSSDILSGASSRSRDGSPVPVPQDIETPQPSSHQGARPRTTHTPSLSSIADWCRAKNISVAAISKLLDSGFRSISDLQLLTADEMPRLELPLADELRLRQGLRDIPGRCPPPIGTTHRPSQDPLSSVPTADAPVPLDTLLQTLQQPLGRPTPSPAQSSNARLYLSSSGQLDGKCLDIVDFVPGVLSPKDTVALPGSEGKLMYDAGPKKPKLESVSPHQWYAANCRIMYKLIIDGDLIGEAISDYLGYTV